MKAITLVALSLLGAAWAVPADEAFARGGYTEYDAIPALDGLNDIEARTHQGTISSVDLLASCPGGPGSSNVARADRCTLINIKNNPDKRVWKTMGDPQLNCKGGVTPVAETLGGTTTVSQTVTVSVNIGFESEALKISGGASISSEEGTSTTQTKLVMFTIPPGKQAVYVTGVNQKSETGNVQVNYGTRQKGHYIWFTGATLTRLTPDPNNVVYDVYVSNCGTNPTDLRSFNR
ncbi:hypothetical protein C8Q80DRAFT_1268973 [Daedaleopsis nitida]|nr:hypothetical protein C8Q80DRAFT_1268973 [Daedaleopsis nitida]